jgi:hypothetical protein
MDGNVRFSLVLCSAFVRRGVMAYANEPSNGPPVKTLLQSTLIALMSIPTETLILVVGAFVVVRLALWSYFALSQPLSAIVGVQLARHPAVFGKVIGTAAVWPASHQSVEDPVGQYLQLIPTV